jgi:hypothetical protein
MAIGELFWDVFEAVKYFPTGGGNTYRAES